MSVSVDEVYDVLIGQGIGEVERFGSVKVMRVERRSWLVAASGVSKEFSIARFAARWVAALIEDEAGF